MRGKWGMRLACVCKVLARIDRIELHVAEGIALHSLSLLFHARDDVLDASALADKDVDAILLVEHGAQPPALCLEVDWHFWDVDRMHVEALLADAERREQVALGESFAVLLGGSCGQPAAVAAHYLVDDHHARVGRRLVDDIFEKHGALLGSGPRAERLRDRVDVIVDSLWQADDAQVILHFCEEARQVRGSRVGVIATNCVEDFDAILDELIGGHLLRVDALLDEAALDAVLDVGHLDARVTNRAPPDVVQEGRFRADLTRHVDGLAEEQPLVAVEVADDLSGWVLL